MQPSVPTRDDVAVDGCRVELQNAELDLLLKVCQKYRSTLPAHLQSSKEQLAIADELLEKLRKLQHHS